MNCNQFQNKWPDVQGGTLSVEEKREWESHQQTCAACRKEVESFESLQQELRGIPPASPLPPVFWIRQTESIMKKIERFRHPFQRFFDFVFQPRTAWVAATLVLLVFLGYQYLLKGPILNPLRQEVASEFSGEGFEIGSEESWDLDLTETQIDQYYAHLAQKYLPAWEDDSEENDWIEDLNEQDLNQAIQYFEKKTERRTL